MIISYEIQRNLLNFYIEQKQYTKAIKQAKTMHRGNNDLLSKEFIKILRTAQNDDNVSDSDLESLLKETGISREQLKPEEQFSWFRCNII